MATNDNPMIGGHGFGDTTNHANKVHMGDAVIHNYHCPPDPSVEEARRAANLIWETAPTIKMAVDERSLSFQMWNNVSSVAKHPHAEEQDAQSTTGPSRIPDSFDPSLRDRGHEYHSMKLASDVQNTPMTPMGPPVRPRKRRFPTLRAKDWEPYKAQIRELYITQNLPLPQVKQIMEEKSGFTATLRQYRTRIIQWKFDKGIKPNEMEAIVRKRQRRKLVEVEKGELLFKVRSIQVEPQKIERWMKRHDVSESSLYCPSPTASTPSAVSCRTISEPSSPHSSPAYLPGEPSSPVRSPAHLPADIALLSEEVGVIAQNLPMQRDDEERMYSLAGLGDRLVGRGRSETAEDEDRHNQEMEAMHRRTMEGKESLLGLDATEHSQPRNDPMPFSDSGYASLRLTREENTVQNNVKERRNTATKECDSYEDADDAKSIYSMTSSSTGFTKETYISQLVEDLVENMPIASDIVEDGALERLYAILPGLLKSFARRFGYMSHDQGSRDVMVFVSKYRDLVVSRLKDCIASQGQKTLQKSSINSEESTSKAKVSAWLHSDSVKEVETQIDLFEGVLETADESEEDFANLLDYRELVVGHPVHLWLLSRLNRELLLVPGKENSMQKLSDHLTNCCSNGAFRNFSRRKGPHVCDMMFHVDWNPLEFLEQQEYIEAPDQAIEQAITITGTGTDAQVLTTAQYLNQTWPLVGDNILKLITSVVKSGNDSSIQTTTMSDNTIVRAWLNDGRLKTQAIGCIDSVAEISEVISWLGAALRSSPKEKGLVYCSPILSNPCIQATSMDRTSFECFIHFQFQTEETDSRSIPVEKNGICWHGLFQNPVAVKGYPIRRKPEKGIGVEIPIEIMAGLSRCNVVTSFAHNLFIKSFCTMLVLTKQIGDVLVWHLLYNEDGEHISYTDSRIHSRVSISDTQGAPLDAFSLGSARHVVGWCSKVEDLTGSPKANYNIRWSGLETTHSKIGIDKFSISAGKVISGGVAFALGKKDKPAYTKLRDDYVSQLRWTAKKLVTLYDVESRRAWLVNGISALLHLVRASLQHDLDDEFSHSSCFKMEDIKDSGLSGKANAFKVLENHANMNLKLHRKPDEEFDEEMTKEDSSSSEPSKTEHSSKRKISYYCLKDRVQQISRVLEQAITYQCEGNTENGYSVDPKATTMNREYIEGFDFMDFATDNDPFPRLATPLKARGRAWVDFAQSISAPTLFGRGFGELLMPSSGSCIHWKTMPKNRDLLAVCCSDLKQVLDRRGDTQTSPWRIIGDLHWHCPGMAFGRCKCTINSTVPCDRVQVFLPRGFRTFWTHGKSPSSFVEAGAVIFGHSRKFSLNWPAQGSPVEEEAEDTEDGSEPLLQEREDSLEDSGLGSSLESSSQSREDTSTSTPVVTVSSNPSHEHASSLDSSNLSMQEEVSQGASSVLSALPTRKRKSRITFNIASVWKTRR